MTSDQEALLFLAKAYDELGYADDARTSGNYGGAVSMAFYAAFYAVRGMLAQHSPGSWPGCGRPRETSQVSGTLPLVIR